MYSAAGSREELPEVDDDDEAALPCLTHRTLERLHSQPVSQSVIAVIVSEWVSE